MLYRLGSLALTRQRQQTAAIKPRIPNIYPAGELPNGSPAGIFMRFHY